MTNVVELHLSDLCYQRLRELILKNCFFMAQEAIGKTARFYSPEYIEAMEEHFPFTIAYFQ